MHRRCRTQSGPGGLRGRETKKNTLPVAARLAVHLHGDTEAGDNAEHAVLWVRRSFGEREADPRDLVIAVTHEQGTQCQAVLSRWTRDVKQRY